MRFILPLPILFTLLASVSALDPAQIPGQSPNSPAQPARLANEPSLDSLPPSHPRAPIGPPPPPPPVVKKKRSFEKLSKQKLNKRLRKETEDEWSGPRGRVLEKIKRGYQRGIAGKKRQDGNGKKERKRGVHVHKGHGNLHMLRERTHKLAIVEKEMIESRKKEAGLEKRGGGTWKGVSSYYLFALNDGPRRAVLDAIKGGGFSVVRIFLAGVHANNKGSGNPAVPDLEPDKVGEYDDTILYKIDKLMADCADRGLKLVIALSDRYALGFWSTNSYAVQLSIVQPHQKGMQSLKVKNANAFYTDSWAIKMFEQRMSHALNHENQLMGGRKWRDLSSVVYAYEAQNEPQGYMQADNPSWVCDRSNYIASLVSGSGIQISSGGGIDTTASLQGWATDCGSIDIVSVHDYGTNGQVTANALARAKNNHPGKTIMLGEWGATGSNKAAKITEFVSALESKGIPWMYWQITQPGAGADDFEVWTSEPSWGALTGGSYSAPPAAEIEWKAAPKSSSKDDDTSTSSSDGETSSASSKTGCSSSTKGSSTSRSRTKSAKASSTLSSEDKNSSEATPTSTSDELTSTIYEAADGSVLRNATLPSNETVSSIPDEGQYSTVSPDDLSRYSIVVPEDSPSDSLPSPTPTDQSDASLPTETPPSSEISSSSTSEGSTSSIESSTSSTESSSQTVATSTDSQTQSANDSLSSTSTDSLAPTSSDSTGPTPTDSLASSAIPTDSSSTDLTDSADPSPIVTALHPSAPVPLHHSNGSLIHYPNCNFTLSEINNGTIHLDTNSTIVVLPSGTHCNSTLLPLDELPSDISHPTPHASDETHSTPLLVFSSDPSTLLPSDWATAGSPETPPSTPTTPQENDTALGNAPSPSPSPEYHEVTLDANALLTMDLSGYSIVS